MGKRPARWPASIQEGGRRSSSSGTKRFVQDARKRAIEIGQRDAHRLTLPEARRVDHVFEYMTECSRIIRGRGVECGMTDASREVVHFSIHRADVENRNAREKVIVDLGG